MTLQDADDAAMDHHEDRFPRVRPLDLGQRHERARQQRVVTLVPGWATARCEIARPLLLDLCACVALPLPRVAFAEPRLEPNVETQPRRHDLGGLACTDEIRRPDRVETLGPHRSFGCLSLTQWRERRVGLPLPPTVGIPRGLAVTNEQQARDGSGPGHCESTRR